MQNDPLANLRGLSDDELVARVRDLTARERQDVVQVVAHLAELDTRDVHFRAGYASLFAYCRDELALSEAEAYNRIEVARAARRFPVILDMLVQGLVNLTTVRLLSPHLSALNHREVLDSARGKRKAEVEEILARLAPRPDVAASVRKLPDASAAAVSSVPSTTASSPIAAGSSPVTATSPAVATPFSTPSPAPPSLRPATRPLAPGRYRLQVTIGYATLQKLTLAKDMLRHAIPSGDDAAILDRALTVLLEEIAKTKFAATDRPRPARAGLSAADASGAGTPRSNAGRASSAGVGTAGSRHIPAEVKRAVWLRDLGRCAFVGTNGRRCTEHGFLEFHHRRPYAIGGEATVTNIELRCRRHNAYEARVFFARDDPPDGRSKTGLGPGSGRPELVPERVRDAGAATRSAGPAGGRSG